MTDITTSAVPPSGAAATSLFAAASTASGRTLGTDGGARDDLLAQVRLTDAFRQLERCFPKWHGFVANLRTAALTRLANNKAINPNNADHWMAADHAVKGVLHRHGIDGVRPQKLTMAACERLLEGQEAADEAAGLDWTTVVAPASRLDDALRDSTTQLSIDLDDPEVWCFSSDRHRILARRVGLDDDQAVDFVRWTAAAAGEIDLADIGCWRIGSATWQQLADEQMGPVGIVDRPVALAIVPSTQEGAWRLRPCLAVDFVRLVGALGGSVDDDLVTAKIPRAHAADLLEGMNHLVLHVGARNHMESRSALGAAVGKELGVPFVSAPLTDKRDRWGGLSIQHMGNDLSLRVSTCSQRGFSTARLGAAKSKRGVVPGASQDLGEAVTTAVELGLPVVLSPDAAEQLDGQIRVGRMKGKPGILTVTRADGMSASTRRVVAEQALPELRKLKRGDLPVVVDGGARQVVRMMATKPLLDDPILLGRQKEMAAYMVVGSGVNASAVGTGKSVMTGRALFHRAATTTGFRAMLTAEGRLLPQWRDELVDGAPSRGMPALTPNCMVRILDHRLSITAQFRRWDREVGEGALIVLVSNSILERFNGELAAIRCHVGIADEALRYANPATDAHRALRTVRFDAWADCWLLTATPRSKHREALDVLVGLAIGDAGMIEDRLNTREAGDLMDEVNAHRLRVNYGPHLLRLTKNDMQEWMPKIRPATPIAVEADPALQDLLDAVRKGGREAYQALLAILKEVRTIDKAANPNIYKAALAKMSRAQAVVLSNVNLYVDASVDPETLKHSKSALAQALVRQGLVDEAMKGSGTGLPLLRSIVATALAERAADEQAIVFAERIWCLRNLAATLRDRGVEAHCADGSLSDAEFEELKRRFVAKEFPILCVSKIGQQGHNLQNASVLCHLDLPWVQPGLEQRGGRAGRIGSQWEYVETLIPYIRGGGIEHVVSVLTPRGAEHHQVLDSFEGVQASDSTVASQLGQITAQVAQSKQDAGFARTAARLRVAASVFGVPAAT
jgi:hypothetical protein